MGCPAACILEKNLVFSICTHDPDTGVLTDADAAPTYRVYEDESDVAILTGTLTKKDDVNTTGFYNALIAVTAANGFEAGKSYTVYIEATVDSDTGGISYTFTANSSIAVSVFDEILIDLADNSLNSGEDITTRKVLRGLFNRFFREVTQTSTAQVVKNDSAAQIATMAVSDDGTTQTKGIAT